MTLDIREVSTPRDLRTFIYLPEEIHAGHQGWVHPIYRDERTYFDPRKNKSFAYCEAIRLLAYRDGEPVGRIMGIINTRYNGLRGERTARFGFLESFEDREVVHGLLESVEGWARSQGMGRVVGPYGFSDQDPEGFLISSESDRATLVTYFNFEWMPRMVEEAGYSKDIDYVVYKIEVPEVMPAVYEKIFERAKKRGSFEVKEFTTRRQLRPWVRPVLQLMNECYSGGEIYGYVPLDEREMEELARKYMPILDPRFVKVVVRDGAVVAFVVGIPDLTEGLRRARGRLFPLGFLHVLRAAKRTRQLDLLLGAIKKPFRGMGTDVLMGVAMLRSAREAGMELIDTHHEMESNTAVRAEMERVGGRVYKRYRVYEKPLPG